jgi:hypothetical protein
VSKLLDDLRDRIGRKTLADVRKVVKIARDAGKSPDAVKAAVLKKFRKDVDDATILLAKFASLP